MLSRKGTQRRRRLCEVEDENVYPDNSSPLIRETNQIEDSQSKPASVLLLDDLKGQVLSKLVIKCSSPLSKLTSTDYHVFPDPYLFKLIPSIPNGEQRHKIVTDLNSLFRKAVRELYEKSRGTSMFMAVLKLKDSVFYLQSGNGLSIKIAGCPPNLLLIMQEEQLSFTDCSESVLGTGSKTITTCDLLTCSHIIDYICNVFCDTKTAVGHIWSTMGFASGVLQRCAVSEKHGYLELNGVVFLGSLCVLLPPDTPVVEYIKFA
jgi:hypothetical protein